MSQNSDRHECQKRIQSAKERLDFARAFVEEVERDMEAGSIARDDGHEAYSRALAAEALALHEYARALELYKKVALREIIPDDENAEIDGQSSRQEEEGMVE